MFLVLFTLSVTSAGSSLSYCTTVKRRDISSSLKKCRNLSGKIGNWEHGLLLNCTGRTVTSLCLS